MSNDTVRHRHRLGLAAVTAVVALLLVVGGTGTAAAQSPIDDCSFSTPGSYEITQDIEAPITVANCIVLPDEDIVVEGNGHRINGTGGDGTVGIGIQPFLAASPSNVTVRNVTVSNFETAVNLKDAEKVELVNVTVRSSETGFSVENGTNVSIEDVTVSQTKVGVEVNDSRGATVRDSFVTPVSLFSLPPGFDFPDDDIDFGDDFPTLGTQSHESAETGIFFNNTLDGKIVDNTVTEFDGPGVEVVSSNPSSNFLPPDFPDDDFPIGDDPITLSEEVSPAQTLPNTVVDNDLTDNAEGILLEDSRLYGVDNNTVTNSTDEGILVSSSSSVSLTDNEVSESGDNGIQITNESSFNNLTDNVAEDNAGAGIYLGKRFPNNNTLVNNTARGGEYGIRLNNAADNNVSESLVEDNVNGIVVEEELVAISQEVETEFVQERGNTFTDDVSRNNDWDFVADSLDFTPLSSSPAPADLPVTNLSIGESTAPDTTLSFNADDVLLKAVDDPAENPDSLENISRYFEAEAGQFGTNPLLNVSLSYGDGDVSSVNESTLQLRRFDGSSWQEVSGSSVDTANNLVSADITSFSDFGVFGEAEGAGCSFAAPLIGRFNAPPGNTGELDPNLCEDLDGDGNGTDPSEAVRWWSQLVQNPSQFDSLSQAQVDALDWSGDGQLTPEDAVLLWSEKVQSGS